MSKTARIAVQATVTAAMFALPLLALAQGPTVPPEIQTDPITLDKVLGWVRQIVTFLTAAGVLIAIIFIIWGGIQYMAAGGDETKAGEAKKRILNGVIGAAVVLGVGLILSTVANLVQ